MGRESGVLQGKPHGFLVAVRADRSEYRRESLVDFWLQSELTGRNMVGKASWILGRSLRRQVGVWSGKPHGFLVADGHVRSKLKIIGKKVSKNLQYKK